MSRGRAELSSPWQSGVGRRSHEEEAVLCLVLTSHAIAWCWSSHHITASESKVQGNARKLRSQESMYEIRERGTGPVLTGWRLQVSPPPC